MRKYSIWMKQPTVANAHALEVKADDVNLEVVGEENGQQCYWNFTIDLDDDDSITVAAMPFDQVAAITSTESL